MPEARPASLDFRPPKAPPARAPRLALLLLLGLAAQACAASRAQESATARGRWEGRGRECVRAFLGRGSPYQELSIEPTDDALLDPVPSEARRTARAAGLEPLIVSALRERRDTGSSASVAFLAAKQDLGLRLISLETQLAAVIFEAECTGELIEAMAFELDQQTQSRGLVYAVSSLVVGSVLATASGIWDLSGDESPGPAVLALAGGVGSAALGAAAFVPREGSLHYEHRHNLLGPIVRNEDPEQLYPAFVFHMLTLPAPGADRSPRERLMAAWQELIDQDVPRSQRASVQTLLYGDGGTYSQDLLALRERMYDALESQLNALARDLELLDRFLVRELAPPVRPAPP
jgi:hypothetical protein